jgi:hypothetical protein
MSIHDLIVLISQLLAKCLSEDRFTGKIVITIHCRDGGIGKATSSTEREFFKKNIDNADKP